MLIPDWKSIEAFPTPLTPGEIVVANAYEALAESMPNAGLNVYIQPYLENYRPDIVVGIPASGILILEVKDWQNDNVDRMRCRAAAEQVRLYRDALIEVCGYDLNRLMANADARPFESAITRLLEHSIRVGVALPFLNRSCARDAMRDLRLDYIVDAEHLERADERLTRLDELPRPTVWSSITMPSDLQQQVLSALWDSLKSWLVPPYHRAEQGNLSLTNLTSSQRTHAEPRGPGWYRLRGPAGSGKTLVVAHKAARLAAEGNRVLVLCFNITLKHYLRDMIARMRYAFDWENIAIRHFHSLLKEIRLEFQVCFTKKQIESIPDDDFIDDFYPKVVAQILDDHPDHPFRFDAVLIDEGQDFPVNWFHVIARCLTENGELLLVRDAEQNVYGKDISWADKESHSIRGLRGARGFRGPWAELKTTWRMSPTITAAVSEFSHRLLGAESFNTDPGRVDQRNLCPGSTFCQWQNVLEAQVSPTPEPLPADPDQIIDPVEVASKELLPELLRAVETVTKAMNPSHPSDFAVLTYTNDLAWKVVDALRAGGFNALNVYDKDGKRDKAQLVRFRKGDGRIKVCTGHSFKGFELWGIIILVVPLKDSLKQARWLYTCMGRAIEGLWVLNADPALNGVSEWFPQE